MKKLFLLLVALIGLAVLIAVVAVKTGGGRSASLADDTVLYLQIAAPLPDYQPAPSLPFVGTSSNSSLAEIYLALRRARNDPKVEGLVVDIKRAAFGLAQAEELRRQIQAVSEAGKVVECYLETAGEGSNGTLAYFVATACPRITLAPPGELNIVGLFIDSAFLRGAFDKLKIEPEFEHVGTYKSAAESYTEYEHSGASREALSRLLDDLYLEIVTEIASARGLEPSRVRQLIDLAPHGAEQALAAGLVDALDYPDAFDAGLEATLGERQSWLDISHYTTAQPGFGKTKIAIAFAQGTIVRGAGGVDAWSQDMYIGSDDFGQLLEGLAQDDSLKAVILRVDSPGGSALASDLLLRQVERLAAVKPVVVSMSSVAASGGYYISAKAEHIVAESMTLTGSIGVVAGRLLTGQFQQELLGISHDVLRRGANADFFSGLEPWRPAQRERLMGLMTGIYDTFVDHVAEGRGLEREAVDAVAQGRIWSGQSAMERGLVDEIGGFDAALEAAARAADLEPADVQLVLYPKPPSLFDFLTGQRRSGLLSTLLRQALLEHPPVPWGLQMDPETARASRPF